VTGGDHRPKDRLQPPMAAAQWRFNGFTRVTRLVPAPGGGLFVVEEGTIGFLGPGRGEAELAAQLDASAAAWARGDRALAGATRKALAFRARLDRNSLEQAQVQLHGVVREQPGKSPLPGLPSCLAAHAASFLVDPEEHLGRAIQARVALHALDQRLPELAAGAVEPEARATKRAKVAGGEGKAEAGGAPVSARAAPDPGAASPMEDVD
jgi:hypothetical protein